MRTSILACSFAGVIGLLGVAAQAPAPSLPEPTTVVLELFTSEGCESCPPADALLRQLVKQPPIGVRIAALGEHVTYWDQLGWRDRFSSAALTERQHAYAQAFGGDSIYTPQAIVNGRTDLVGSDASSIRDAIIQAKTQPHGTIRLSVSPTRSGIAVSVVAENVPAPDRGDRDVVVVAITEDDLTTNVQRGENRGRTLTHAAVVHQMIEIGDLAAQPAHGEMTIDPSWRRDRVKVVAFVQEFRSRRIVAAATTPLAP